MSEALGLPEAIDACLFDLDGLLSRTAELQAEAWKRTFDAFLSERTARSSVRWAAPFDAAADFMAYVDGRPRADGARSFLAPRGGRLPEDSPADRPSPSTVHRLGARKNRLVHELMAERG